MIELTQDINWIAVATGTVLAFVAGWVWYSPLLFGDRWADGLDVNMANKVPIVPMALQVIGLFLLSWFVGVTAAGEALLTLILGALAFLLLAFSGETFAGHPRAVRLINAGYWVLVLVVMILVNAVI